MQIGLKLWSDNDFYINEAKKLFELKIYDYIELYVLPNSKNHLDKWKELKDEHGIKFAVHAPHFAHGFNFSDKKLKYDNLKLANLVKEFSQNLKAIYCIFHPGINGNFKESLRQIENLRQDFEFIIENKPYIVNFKGEKLFCMGSKFEELKAIKDLGIGLCLDIGHCFCSANYQNLDIYEYLKALNSLDPFVYHLSDNDDKSYLDAHLNFGCGNFNFDKILQIIDKNKILAIETNKNTIENLDDFKKDSDFIKKKIQGQKCLS